MIQDNGNTSLGSLKALTERLPIGEHVTEYLRQSIIDGSIPAGDRLVESKLAEAFGVSRTPVREAIHKLEREGYVSKMPRGGFAVQGLSREDIEETFGIRSVLEGYAARIAAVKHRSEELDVLESKITEYTDSLDRGDIEALPAINTEFHDLLYALSRSPKLLSMINGLRDRIYRFRQIILKQETLARISHEDHRRMLALIRQRDAEEVERVVREHILRGQNAVLKVYDKT
ncbi:MAG: GntR family transcriptional regulator [Desulfobacteraceae bacterium]|nr:GntR family transcriptional regulator [Desulfobacteraceae bacterium]